MYMYMYMYMYVCVCVYIYMYIYIYIYIYINNNTHTYRSLSSELLKVSSGPVDLRVRRPMAWRVARSASSRWQACRAD